MVYRKSVCAIAITLLLSVSLNALEFAFRLTPELALPTGNCDKLFNLGASVSLNSDIELFNFLSTGPEFGYMYVPYDGGSHIQILNAGLSAGAFAFPLSRLRVQTTGTFGIYQALSDNGGYGNLWWKVAANAGFRVNPSVALSASGGYVTYLFPDEPLYTGVLAGVSAQYFLDTKAAEGNVAVSLDQSEPVFPLFYSIYKENSIGKLKIVNNETAEIRDVTVSFRSGDYTASLMLCGNASVIMKRKSVELPLYADFADKIQDFTENGKLSGEVVISYKLLGEERTAVKSIVVPVYNRNTLRWIDSAVLASYISPNSPEVLDYTKYVVGLARDKLRTGLNRNMQFAMYVLDGLKTGGVSNTKTTTTPYAQFHLDTNQLDYIQYPFQTLSFRSGDLDDLGVLVAACFESVGIRSAVIPLKDDFVVAFSLGISAADAEDLFANTDNLLTIEDEVWIPLSMSVFREGFVNSWFVGVENLNAAFAAEDAVDVVVLSEAWKTYPAASITGTGARFAKPDQDATIRAVETDLLRYISNEFGPKIRAIQEDIKAKGATVQHYTSLGILYVRAGMYDDAKAAYERAASMGSVTAMVNIGNIFLLDKAYPEAISWFKKALEAQSDNKGAKSGLDRAQTELSQ
jgi:tetratricopeptide (TPR) repeat protein